MWGTTALMRLFLVSRTMRLLSGLWATYTACAAGSAVTTSPCPPTPGRAITLVVLTVAGGALADGVEVGYVGFEVEHQMDRSASAAATVAIRTSFDMQNALSSSHAGVGAHRCCRRPIGPVNARCALTRSEERTSELQSRQYTVC